MKRELARPAKSWTITKDGIDQISEGPVADFLNRSEVGEIIEFNKNHFLLEDMPIEERYVLAWSERKPMYLEDEGYHDEEFYIEKDALIDSIINCGEFFVISTNTGMHVLKKGAMKLLVYSSPN